MKIAIISDTHNDIDSLKLFVEKTKGKVDLVIHLGDDSPDTEILETNGFNVIKVPGVYEQIYSSESTKRRLIKEFNGKKYLLTHTPTKHSNDLPQEAGPEALAREVDFVLYGHTHIPKIEKRPPPDKTWINPGHMKQSDKRGYAPSYAILETEPEITVNIYNLHTDEIIIKWKG